MAVPKSNTHRDYVRYAEHCLKMVPVGTRSGISQCPTRDGGRMVETSGCCPASAKADYTIKVIALRVRRITANRKRAAASVILLAGSRYQRPSAGRRARKLTKRPDCRAHVEGFVSIIERRDADHPDRQSAISTESDGAVPPA